MDEESLQQLTDTIVSQGFQGVLVARAHPQQAGMYQLTAGHRRREAARRAGLKTLPIIVHAWSDQEMATLAATENIQREDLTPLEEGKLFHLMISELGLTQVEVANAVKKDRGYVRNRLRLATAPADIQAFVQMKADSMRAVIYLLDIDDPAERAPVIEQLLKKTLTTEDLPAYIEQLKQRPLIPTPSQLSAPVLFHAETTSPAQDATQVVDKHAEGAASSQARATIPPFQEGTTTPAPPTAIARESHKESQRDLSPARTRQVKLKTILRYLGEYQKSLKGQEEGITEDERDLLRQISNTVQGLL